MDTKVVGKKMESMAGAIKNDIFKLSINRILLFLFFYVFLFLLNNSNTLILSFFQEGTIWPLDFVNLKMVISIFLLFFSAFEVGKVNREYKNIFYLIIGGTVAYNAINGLLPNFNLLVFLLIYLYILLITFTTMIITKFDFIMSMVVSFSIMLLSIFVISLFGFLTITKYLIIISSLACLYIILKRKKKLKNNLAAFSNYALIIFSILFLIAIIGGIGRYVHTWDEFSHWAYDAKAVIGYAKLSTSEEIMSATRAYPPILSLWQYFISLFSGFSEQNLYIGLSIFIFIYMMPAFSWLKKSNNLRKILLVTAVFSTPYLFGGVYSYDTLYADVALSMVFASSLLIYTKLKDDGKSQKWPLVLSFLILSLIKPNGFVIVFITIFIIFLMEMLEKIKHFNFKECWICFKQTFHTWWKYIALSFSAIIIWNIYLKIVSLFTTSYYNFTLVPDSLKSALQYKMDKSFLLSFCNRALSFFDSTIFYGITNLNLFVFIMVCFVLLYFMFYSETKNSKSSAIKKVSSFAIGYLAFYALTLISIFVTFSKYEASTIASFGRYLNCFHFGIFIFILAYLSRGFFQNTNVKKIAITCFYLLIILNIPFTKITYFVSDLASRMQTKVTNQNIYDKIKIVNENTNPNSLIYVIDQEDKDNIMSVWYTRYFAFPRKINASSSAITWKIRTDKNKDDLADWGLTASEWAKHIVDFKFNYVFLYSVDDEFFKETSFMYDNVELAKKYRLFKIEKTNVVKLIPIA